MAALVLRRVTRILFVTDALVLACTLAVVYIIRFGTTPTWETAEDSGLLHLSLSPRVQTLLIYVIWLAVLATNRSRDYRIIGSDSTEYKRVAMSGFLVPMFLAFAALLFKVDVPRLYIAAAVVCGTLVLLAHRWLWRQWLVDRRVEGKYLTRVALLGPLDQVQALAKKMTSSVMDGYVPVALIPDSGTDAWLAVDGGKPLPQVGFDSNLATGLEANGCKALLVVGSQALSNNEVKRIAWRLEGLGIDLVVVSPLKDVGTHRLEVRPLAGTPVFVVEVPRFKGWKHLVKGAFDAVAGTLAFLITLPIVVVFGLLVWAYDRGPIFFKQRRVGKNGQEFYMLKLRSMRVGSEQLHQQMLKEANVSPNAVMYKNPNDPRVTPIGRFIRRWSIDELPQFINVLRGEMSMVGPRPPMPSEVAGYEADAFRRLLVKPGITGLWQVSGRNELTWEETVALDLNYVENWSVIGDILLIIKTAKAIL